MSVRQFEEERQERERKLELENERLRKENADLSKIVLGETYDEFMAQREIKRLREALEFYAKRQNHGWSCDKSQYHRINQSEVMIEGGQLARQALGGETNE